MAIAVTCPKCFKRFQVSDKFAGKTGPCPNCKNTIQVPKENETVVVHASDDGAPKDSKGQSVAKPIKRTETDVTGKGLIITIVSVAAVLIAAVVVRVAMDPVPLWVRIAGALIVAPPLVWAGYSFTRDGELAGYTGVDLRNRVAIASLLMAATWLIYWLVPMYLFDLDMPSQMSFLWFGMMVLAMLGAGGVICTATFELEFVNGVIHGGLYIVVTILLAVIAGMTLAGQPIENDFERLTQPRASLASAAEPLA